MQKTIDNKLINNPRYAIYYKGKEVKKYPYYRQAKAFCIKHNGRLFGYERCVIIDLSTGEEINNLFE